MARPTIHPRQPRRLTAATSFPSTRMKKRIWPAPSPHLSRQPVPIEKSCTTAIPWDWPTPRQRPRRTGWGWTTSRSMRARRTAVQPSRSSLDKVQRSGVRTVAVERRRLETVIRAPGVAKPNERTFHTATLRTDGFIEKLYVNETGRYVTAGEPMFRIYSPQMVAVQVDYRTANAPPNSPDESGALQRLRNLGMPECRS